VSQHPLAALALARALVGPSRERTSGEAEDRRSGRRATHIFVAEHYSPGLDAGQVEAFTRRLRAANDSRGGDVRFLGAAALPGDDSLLSIFAAPSLEAVARLVERAEVVADRIVPALWRAGEE
jgi:hypothetical protein